MSVLPSFSRWCFLARQDGSKSPAIDAVRQTDSWEMAQLAKDLAFK